MAANIKIAIPGKSIQSTDPRDFSLNLSYQLWKILTETKNSTDFMYFINNHWNICYENDGTDWHFCSKQGFSNGEFSNDGLGWLYNSGGPTYDIAEIETVDGLSG